VVPPSFAAPIGATSAVQAKLAGYSRARAARHKAL